MTIKMKAATLPKINLSLEVTGDPEKRRVESNKLVDAFSNHGFCYITGIEGYQADELLKWTKWFYNGVPEEVRFDQLATITYDPSRTKRMFRGYFPLLKNSVAFAQGYDIAPDNEEPLVEGQYNFFLENTPRLKLEGREEEVDAFYKTMLHHHDILNGACNLMMSLIAEAGGERSDYFDFFPTSPYIRPMRYPERNKEDIPDVAKLSDGTALSLQEHADSSLVTLVQSFGYAGLEIKLDNVWFWVPQIEGEDSIVVNVGQILTGMSNGRFKATIHRVVLPGDGRERYSLPFFFYPAYNANINTKIPKGLLLDKDNSEDDKGEKPFASFFLRKIATYPTYAGILDNLPQWMRKKYLDDDDEKSPKIENNVVIEKVG